MIMKFSRICVLVFVPMVLAGTEGPRCPPSAPPDHCTEGRHTLDEYFFNVTGENMKIDFGHGNLYLTCRNDVQLDSKSLPRFALMTVVPIVTLSACAAPAVGFAAALHELNVTVGKVLSLENVPAAPSLAAHHFSGLNLRGIQISAPFPPAPFLRPEPSFLKPLGTLFDLTLNRVALPPKAAMDLPAGLRSLSLYDVGLSALPARAAFARLPALVRLALFDSVLEELDLSALSALADVEVNAPLDGITLGPHVERAKLLNVRGVELRGNCSGLRWLTVEGGDATLPSSWLAKCHVRELHLTRLKPGAVGADELRDAKDLSLLEARFCELRSLPSGWINSSTALKTLDLSHNKLTSIPSEVITGSPALTEVNLSYNNLKAGEVRTLSAAALTKLVLDDNPLGDLCGANSDPGYITNDLSELWAAPNLTSLSLQRTGATRVCPDWRRLGLLKSVDLQDNNITALEYDDLQWTGANNVVVYLRRNPVRRVTYTKRQYERALAYRVDPTDPSPPRAVLYIDDGITCDCGEYWFALTLRQRPRHGQAELQAVCDDGRPLKTVPTDELVCYLPREQCPERCECSLVGERSRISCPDAGLTAPPVPPAAWPLPPPAELLLPRNNITEIDVASLTAGLEVLDLTDNLIAHVDAGSVDTLFADGRRVLLDGNPLSCGCGDAALQRALAARGAAGDSGSRCRIAAEASCRDAAESSSSTLWALPAVALLLVAGATLTACLVRPSTRRRIKVFLFERGVCVRWALDAAADPAAEAARDYDAFVSFSHHDASYAARLAERLERGPGARRLCMHERDWTPGEWIPAQIASSVSRSRRTVALVSESFLASPWARAELREAYGAAMREGRARLLAVLLPGLEPPRASAAPELAAYLAAVTYLRWDDPHFWDKLLLAVPPPPPGAPRPPCPSPSPADETPPPPPPPP